MKLPKLSFLSQQVAIDLGSSATRIWIPGQGVVVDEPTAIAIEAANNKVLAVGSAAQEMMGRVSQTLTVSSPLKNGVIVDLDLTVAMVKVFLQKVLKAPFFFRPTVAVSVPSAATDTDRQVIFEAMMQLGAGEVVIVDQILAAAIGAGVPIADASGSLVCQLGAGLAEVGMISLGSVIASQSSPFAGDELDERLQRLVRQQTSLAIGRTAARQLKEKVASFLSDASHNMRVAGQDIVAKVPQEKLIESTDLRPLLVLLLAEYMKLIRQVLAKVPPELTADVIDKGMLLSGGLAKMEGLGQALTEQLQLPVAVVDDPQLSAVRGISQILENLDLFRESIGYHQSR